MKIKAMACPSCGYPMPETARPNQLFKCPACQSTLFVSDWQIGETQHAVVVTTPTRIYTVTDLLMKDDLCNVYRCLYNVEDKARQGYFRIARDPADSDLVQNEAQALYHLQIADDYEEFRPFLPLVLESFLYRDATLGPAQQVNIFGLHEKIGGPNELYSLQEVREYYGGGIDPRDMAWMWRRLLYALGFAHRAGVIHGAALPTHVLIEPVEHKLVLSGWGFAVRSAHKSGNTLRALSLLYEDWYPPEVKARQPATPALDFYLAARSMLYLMGMDPLGAPEDRRLDAPLQAYFARCLSADPGRRPQAAWKLLEEFDRVIEGLWGPRQFRVFNMPYKA